MPPSSGGPSRRHGGTCRRSWLVCGQMQCSHWYTLSGSSVVESWYRQGLPQPLGRCRHGHRLCSGSKLSGVLWCFGVRWGWYCNGCCWLSECVCVCMGEYTYIYCIVNTMHYLKPNQTPKHPHVVSTPPHIHMLCIHIHMLFTHTHPPSHPHPHPPTLTQVDQQHQGSSPRRPRPPPHPGHLLRRALCPGRPPHPPCSATLCVSDTTTHAAHRGEHPPCVSRTHPVTL